MSEKKDYAVICYMKVIPDDMEALTLEEAKKEKDNLKFMQPEHIFRVERLTDIIEGEDDVVQ